MIPLAFQGGTALRFLFDLPRFSEDLDFALERPARSRFDRATTKRLALRLSVCQGAARLELEREDP